MKYKNVVALRHLSSEHYKETMEKAALYTSFRWFEPFGLVTVEAMSSGAIPIIYASGLNGSWTDIVAHGKYGFGFKTSEEFLDIAERILHDERLQRRMANVAQDRSKAFSKEEFKRNFLRVWKALL